MRGASWDRQGHPGFDKLTAGSGAARPDLDVLWLGWAYAPVTYFVWVLVSRPALSSAKIVTTTLYLVPELQLLEMTLLWDTVLLSLIPESSSVKLSSKIQRLPDCR